MEYLIILIQLAPIIGGILAVLAALLRLAAALLSQRTAKPPIGTTRPEDLSSGACGHFLMLRPSLNPHVGAATDGHSGRPRLRITLLINFRALVGRDHPDLRAHQPEPAPPDHRALRGKEGEHGCPRRILGRP